MLTPRRLRAALARWVPEAVKGPLRGRLFGYRAAGVDLGFRLAEADGELAASVDGLELRLPAAARDDALYHFSENGESVEEMHGFLRAARETGGVLFDVGAARGLFSAVFCLASPANRAFAYEPSPVFLRDAEAVARMNGLGERLAVLPTAVGGEPARARAGVDSLGLIDFAPPPGAEVREVEIVTLDAECERLGISPSVVKIDVEGHEAEVLRGAADLLRTRKPLLFLELHLDHLEKRGVSPREMVDLLRGHGYRFRTSLGEPLSPAAVHGSANAVLRFIAGAD